MIVYLTLIEGRPGYAFHRNAHLVYRTVEVRATATRLQLSANTVDTGGLFRGTVIVIGATYGGRQSFTCSIDAAKLLGAVAIGFATRQLDTDTLLAIEAFVAVVSHVALTRT